MEAIISQLITFSLFVAWAIGTAIFGRYIIKDYIESKSHKESDAAHVR